MTTTVFPGVVEISVADKGPGVSPADRERVFKPFYRGRASRLAEIPGAGLGPVIAHEIATAHGGYVSLDTHRLERGS